MKKKSQVADEFIVNIAQPFSISFSQGNTYRQTFRRFPLRTMNMTLMRTTSGESSFRNVTRMCVQVIHSYRKDYQLKVAPRQSTLLLLSQTGVRKLYRKTDYQAIVRSLYKSLPTPPPPPSLISRMYDRLEYRKLNYDHPAYIYIYIYFHWQLSIQTCRPYSNWTW